jgi:hypothetical protein
LLREFERAAKKNNPARVRELLLEAVSGFVPQCEVKDVVMKHRQARDVLPPVAAGEAGTQDEEPAINVVNLHR